MPSDQPTPDEMQYALAQQGMGSRVNKGVQANPLDALTQGLAPMLYGAVKGTGAGILGAPGDVNALLREYMTPRLPKTAQDFFARMPAGPTSEQLAARAPNMTKTLGMSPAAQHSEDIGSWMGTNVVAPIVQPAAIEATKNMPVGMAIKAPGGNWRPAGSKFAPDSVKEAINNLKIAEPVHRDEAIAVGGAWAEHADTPATQARMAQVGAINNWVDTKLQKYVRNQMSTPDDPLRLMHQGLHPDYPGQSISHIPGAELENDLQFWTPDRVSHARVKAGYPEEGFANKTFNEMEEGDMWDALHNTRRGEIWEDLSDSQINTRPASEYRGYELSKSNPWLNSVDPNTPIHSVPFPSDFGKETYFDHLVNELESATDGHTDLPAYLQWKPEDLQKVTVPQAVKRVHDINEYREMMAARAEKEGMLDNLKANPYREAPNFSYAEAKDKGGKWVAIPDTDSNEGMTVCKSIGQAGGWCTKDEGNAQRYGGGVDRQLYALLDSDGRPHVQVQVVDHPSGLEDKPPNIYEIKPPGNYYSSERAAGYARKDPNYLANMRDAVKDFLNSREWGDVSGHDVEMHGLVDLGNPNHVIPALQDALPTNLPHERRDILNTALHFEPDAPRFMTEREFADFVNPDTPPTYGESGPPVADTDTQPEGHKRGGQVHITNNPDEMRLALLRRA